MNGKKLVKEDNFEDFIKICSLNCAHNELK